MLPLLPLFNIICVTSPRILYFNMSNKKMMSGVAMLGMLKGHKVGNKQIVGQILVHVRHGSVYLHQLT